MTRKKKAQARETSVVEVVKLMELEGCLPIGARPGIVPDLGPVVLDNTYTPQCDLSKKLSHNSSAFTRGEKRL